MTQDLGVCTALAALEAALGPVAGMQIVDVGSGEGSMAAELAARGAIVTGMDPLGPEQPWAQVGPGRYRLLRTGAETMPFADGAVDAVLFIFSLHHLPHPVLSKVLHEAARVLRPGGPLYVAEPLATGPMNEVTSLFHDEAEVRAAAAAILADHAALFQNTRRLGYASRRHYAAFDDYASRMTASMRFNGDYTAADIRAQAVQDRFAAVHARVAGVFETPVRVDVLTR